MEALTDFVNTEFQKVCEFFRSNRLSLHPEKTKFMLFTSNPLLKSCELDIVCNNNNLNMHQEPDHIFPIKQVKQKDDNPSIRFLGVLFDPDLSFKSHIKIIMTKVSKGIFALRSAKTF